MYAINLNVIYGTARDSRMISEEKKERRAKELERIAQEDEESSKKPSYSASSKQTESGRDN